MNELKIHKRKVDSFIISEESFYSIDFMRITCYSSFNKKLKANILITIKNERRAFGVTEVNIVIDQMLYIAFILLLIKCFIFMEI